MTDLKTIIKAAEPRHVSDASLVDELKKALSSERQALAQFLIHLSEYDCRRLYEVDGYSSLFKFLVDGLCLSEPAAAKRLAAMRVLRRWPEVSVRLAEGAIHLTGLYALSKHLTENNYEQVLDACRGKSKSRIDEYLAKEFGVKALIKATRDVVRTIAQPSQNSSLSAAPTTVSLPAELASVSAHILCSPPPKEQLREVVQPLGTETGPPNPSKPSTNEIAASSCRFEKTVRLSADLSSEAYTDLKRARDLMGAKDFGAVIGKALKAYLLKKDPLRKKVKSATIESPRSKKQAEANSEVVRSQAEGEAGKPRYHSGKGIPAKRSRYIPQAERTKVCQRDEAICTYVSPDGRRCSETSALQLDHRLPFAKGGENRAENLQLMCGIHNRLRARQEFGANFMAEKIFFRARRHNQPVVETSAGT